MPKLSARWDFDGDHKPIDLLPDRREDTAMTRSDEAGSSDGEMRLYDRIGGEDAIADLVVEFYVKVLGDPELNPFFKDVKIERLHVMQREFFSAALDGPIKYTGKPLHSVHAGRGIRPRHMKRFVGHMLETLEKFDLSEGERSDIISRINTNADEIMGGYGSGG
jgi:hemoglobin